MKVAVSFIYLFIWGLGATNLGWLLIFNDMAFIIIIDIIIAVIISSSNSFAIGFYRFTGPNWAIELLPHKGHKCIKPYVGMYACVCMLSLLSNTQQTYVCQLFSTKDIPLHLSNAQRNKGRPFTTQFGTI